MTLIACCCRLNLIDKFSRAEGDEGKRRAHAVFSKLAKLFGVPSHWRPKGYAVRIFGGETCQQVKWGRCELVRATGGV